MEEMMERRALLNTLKIASALDGDRVPEMQKAAMDTMRALGWTCRDDAWMAGPLMEIAANMARTCDKVDERLPALAAWVKASGVSAPKRWGLDVEPDDSLTVAALSIAGRVQRLVDQETFAMAPEEAKAWCMESIARGATYLFEELESRDASAASDPGIGADGRRMVLLASLRESANLFEPIWLSEAADLAVARAGLPWQELRRWLEDYPEYDALSRINVRYGKAVDRLMDGIEVARESALRLQGSILHPESGRDPAASPTPNEAERVAANTARTVAEQAPAAQPAGRQAPRFRGKPG